MAIRFVDVKPDGAETDDAVKAGQVRRTRAPASVSRGAPDTDPADGPPEATEAGGSPASVEATAPAADPVADGVDAPLPGLPHAKPEPKPRGRKKPMSAVGADRPADRGAAAGKAEAPPAPLLEGLLPELQAHAKPTPKPRGRKKAFG